MEVILREDVTHLGRIGEIVKVKPGYARNYLIPYGKAYKATEGARRQVDAERSRQNQQLELRRSEADQLAERLSSVALHFSAKTGDGDRLFGSITTADIADKLAAAGYQIDKRVIELTEPIRVLGEHCVSIRLHPEVQPEIAINVTKEE